VRPSDVDLPLFQLLCHARDVGVPDDQAADVDIVPIRDDPFDGGRHGLVTRRKRIPGEKGRREGPTKNPLAPSVNGETPTETVGTGSWPAKSTAGESRHGPVTEN
jgi:hypothetical protein